VFQNDVAKPPALFQLFQVLDRSTTGCETIETSRDIASKHRLGKSLAHAA
jgi:hypothetical protein